MSYARRKRQAAAKKKTATLGLRRPLLSLQMMVKNEAKSIRAVLETVKPFIDAYTIFDTGSTDGTQDIAREVMVDLPGTLHEGPWLGYKDQRNFILSLDRDNGCEFSLMLNADEFLKGGEELRKYLEAQRDTKGDCHFIKLALEDGLAYQARILRTGSAWTYDDFDCGVDEVPVHPVKGSPVVGIPGQTWIEHIIGDLIARMDTAWEVHIPNLRAALERNPKNERALELLIQKLSSFFPCMDEEELTSTAAECVELYQRRFELPFVNEEQRRLTVLNFIDTARLGKLFTPDELLVMANELCKAETSRPEPYLLRALIATSNPKCLVSDVYRYSREAAEVAEKVRMAGGLKSSAPLDMSTEWKAHRFAAIAAANLSKKYPEQRALAQDHINAGLSVGGPWAMFKGILQDAGGEQVAP